MASAAADAVSTSAAPSGRSVRFPSGALHGSGPPFGTMAFTT
eukprot:CAMPEP_0179469352 /NCGR_PEP_ID=MMETSP0799-20121207/50063_1 /TAXON_ID=46947 /ORGANISM="Geminigera cryophila, Strain CCMP2564" /LENGTH=41 /DNA_ID= /DNA_START= /DNA_END= /DNA_ORIENTATION=